jgi:hypothetical protein
MEETIVSIKHGDVEIIIKLPWDVDITTLVNTIKGALITVGFHPDNVKELFSE